ncbi:hypothetical protein JTE90_017997 [Oedothorax gibbosus]|uniref:Uncharacterized protein n=1 Tax=Oedothorax gibbosus TaxID=931172 RepID=A0AAV6V9R8_9ARAC|nr:hypothetical protein JTE90_017997 [Oedothorax gibbosus]
MFNYIQQTKNRLEIPKNTKREAERSRIKTYKIIAEHIGPSKPTSNIEQQNKFDSVEFEEKNVDTVEEVFTTLEEVTTNILSSDKPKRSPAEYPEKYLKKRFYYEMKSSSNNSSPPKISKNVENKSPNRKDYILNKGYENFYTSDKASESTKRQSPGASKLEAGSTTLNYNKSFNSPVTPPLKADVFINSKNDTKRTFGYSGNNTKFVDLNDPKLNFSYQAKPGDEIVLRKDRRPKSSNQSERTKKDDILKKVDKEVDIYEEIFDKSNDKLNNSNAVPNIEDDVLKLAEPLMKLENVSGGQLNWNMREEAGGKNYFRISNQREAPGEVIYVLDRNSRKIACDSFWKQLFRSNMFLATLIFVLIVTVIILLLMLIYNVEMRRKEKNKYKKLSLKVFGHRVGKETKNSALGIKNVVNSAGNIGRGLLCKPVLSSEEIRRTRLNKDEDAYFRKDTKGLSSSDINGTKYAVSDEKLQKKGKMETHDSESQLQHETKEENNSNAQVPVSRKIRFENPEKEQIYNETRNEILTRSIFHGKDNNFETSTHGKASQAGKNHKSEKQGENSEKHVERYKDSDENKDGKIYSIHKHLSNEGPIISYTRIQKRKPIESNSSVNVKYSKVKAKVWNGKTAKSSLTSHDTAKSKVVDWLQRKYSAISSGFSSSSDNEELVKTKSSKSKSKEQSSIGTKIKDMFFGLGTGQIDVSSDDSDTDAGLEEKKKKRKAFMNKKNISKMSMDPKIDLESMTSDVEFSSSDENVPPPPPKPKELVSKIVKTGDCKKIDDMLLGHGWQRSLYFGQGIRTIENETTVTHEQDSADKDEGAVTTASSLLALQNEVGKYINIAEENSPAAYCK